MINLIRKNGQTNVTAFQDVVLFDYALGGQSGVLKNVGNELALEAVTGRQVRVKDGMASIQGYQWEIESGSYETVELNTPPTGSTVAYYYLFAQIDLRDATNQKLTLVLQTAAAAFTNFPAGEDLKANPSGVAMLPLYTFEQTASGVRNIKRLFPFLSPGLYTFPLVIKRLIPCSIGDLLTEELSETLKAPIVVPNVSNEGNVFLIRETSIELEPDIENTTMKVSSIKKINDRIGVFDNIVMQNLVYSTGMLAGLLVQVDYITEIYRVGKVGE